MNSDNRVHILAEQGDLGLWDTPVTKAEQQTLNEQGLLNKKNNDKSIETENKH